MGSSMNGLFNLLSLETFEASPNATSSPASASGATPSGEQGSPMIGLSGLGPVPADPSPRRGSKKASTTLATFGRNGFGSSASAGLTSSLVSRLQQRTRGSILYRLTWKLSVTPSGRLIYRLRASAAPISDSDLNGWPTPTTPSGGQSVPPGTTASGRRPDGSKATVTLENVAAMAGWATPAAVDRPRSEATFAKSAAFRKRNAGQNTVPLYLGEQAALAGWASPSQRDYRTPNLESFAERGGGHRGEQLNNQAIHQGPALTGSSAEIAAGARLNPAHARWLMRLPPVWDACAVTATPSTRKRRPSS